MRMTPSEELTAQTPAVLVPTKWRLSKISTGNVNHSLRGTTAERSFVRIVSGSFGSVQACSNSALNVSYGLFGFPTDGATAARAASTCTFAAADCAFTSAISEPATSTAPHNGTR